MLGRAANEGLDPWGTGGFELPGTTVEDVEVEALTRGAGSGLDSPRGGFLSGEPGSDLVAEPVVGLVSDGLDLVVTEEQQKEPTWLFYVQGKIFFFF